MHAVAVLALGVTACFDDPASVGREATSTGEGSGSTGSSSGSSGSAGSESTSPGDTTGAAEDLDTSEAGSADSGTATSGGSPGSTGGCASHDPEILWAEEAEIVPPMELEVAPLLPDTPMMARSYAGSAGTITFSFELPCAASVEIHALVRDSVAGIANGDDPDSYFVRVDEGDEEGWTYGCGTGRVRDQTWLWQRVSASTEGDCDKAAMGFDLSAGAHEVTLRNRESGGGTVFAAIAAVVVSDDPELDPSTLYDPTP